MFKNSFNKITWLKVIVVVLLCIGIIVSCTPFVKFLKPPLGALEKWQVEIDLSTHAIGELKEYSGIVGPIWVYRRTSEQITWLDTHEPTVVAPFILKHSDSMEFNGKYRSVKKEFFVFSEWRYRDKTLLQVGNSWNNCGRIKYIEGNQKVINNQTFNGVIACLHDFNKFQLDAWGHIYDVAGNASTKHIVPLSVPYYEFNKKGILVITPFPRVL